MTEGGSTGEALEKEGQEDTMVYRKREFDRAGMGNIMCGCGGIGGGDIKKSKQSQ